MKKLKLLVLILISITTLTGCFKRDNMDNINIVTTTYPIEYLIQNIYGYNSTITSIYPNGINVSEYKITDKKIKEYATKNNIFIYNGLTNDKSIAANLLNKNNELKIIDVTKGIALQRDEEELWLCPSNYLMLAQNIKNELVDYTNSTVIINEIEKNYDELKLNISRYDAELKLIADNANNKSIIVGNDVFKFLEKYGFTVYSVEDNDLFIQSDYTNAKKNIEDKSNSYIFILDTDEINENTQKLVDMGAKLVKINSITNRSDDEVETGYNYEIMMNEFIEQLKTEAYN